MATRRHEPDTVTWRISPLLAEKLRRRSERDGVSEAMVIENALKAYLRETPAPAAAPAPAPVPSPALGDPTLVELLAAMRETEDRAVMMSFIPRAVLLLESRGYPREAVWRAIEREARNRTIECQAEAGLGRFTAEELAAAPPGPRQGFRLIWGRAL